MTYLEEIKKILSQHKAIITNKYKIKEISIFGSCVRGEHKEDSDIDILVEFNAPIGFFEFLELEEYLQQILGVSVDLVSKKALKPRIGAQILKEAEAI